MYSTDDLLQWLENWVASDFEKNHEHTCVQIRTIDNPGWGITINLPKNFSNVESPLTDVTKGGDDWYYCVIKDSKFEGDGGLFNLIDIFNIFKQFNCEDINQLYGHQKMRGNGGLTWLLQWFASQCNGDWEHGHGIKIRTIDNPGWRITIDLGGTDCENKQFNDIEKETSAEDWYHCFLRDNKFEGAGGSHNLIDILYIFKEWAENC